MVEPTGYAIVALLSIILIFSRNIHKFALNKDVRDPDGYVHMVISREFRQNNHRVPKQISASAFDWTFAYTYLVHFLLSFIPEQHYERIDEIFPTVMDLLYVGLLIALIPTGLLNNQDLPLVLVLFLTTPQFLQYAAGRGLSARKPGIILGSISFLSFVIWATGGSSWILGLSVVFASLTHLTSRFGTQAIFFFYLAFTILHPAALLVLVSSFVVSVFISGGTYLTVLYSHLLFWYDYATRKQFVFLYDGFKSTDTIRRFLTARSISGVLVAVYESVLLKALLNNPYAIGAAAVVVVGLQRSSTFVPPELMVWFGAGLGLCVLTTMYGLRFLGQPGRYLNFAFIPGALIVVEGYRTLPVGNILFFGALVGIGVAMITGHILSFNLTSTSGEEKQALNEVVEFLKSRNSETVLVQPRHLGAEIAWKAPNISVSDYFGDGFSSQSAAIEAKEMFADAPYVTNNLENIEKVIKPELILFNKSNIGSISEECLSPPDVKPLFKNEMYSVYSWEQYK